MFILIVQPYKKSYMNVLDGLLLALLGLVTLLLVTFQYLHNITDGNEALALIICSLPQFILLLNATYRQLKEKRIVQSIARQVGTMLKQVCTQNHADQLSDANTLPH